QEVRHDRRAVDQLDVEHEPVLGNREMQRIRPLVVIDRRERIVLEQIVDCDAALMLDLWAGSSDRAFVERDLDETCALPGIHLTFNRMATERACASSPSASPSAIAAGPSARRASASSRRIEVRFMKSSTPRPDENRAERAVGST